MHFLLVPTVLKAISAVTRHSFENYFCGINTEYHALFERPVVSEAVAQRCSAKKVILEISRNSQVCNFIKKEVLAQVFSCEFCAISKKTFLHRTPLVTASVVSEVLLLLLLIILLLLNK